MSTNTLTIKDYRKEIKKSPFFKNVFDNLLLNKELEEKEVLVLLKNAIVFINFGDVDLQKLGYKILINYSTKYNDYKPLYDFAINKGYIPISKMVELKHVDSNEFEQHFFNLFFSAYQENFKEKNYYISSGQKKLIEFSNQNNSNFVLVAPTSYGKSEIIVNKIYSNLDKKTCIIVPSKALLAQTKKRLLNSTQENNIQRIITHPEMYKGNEVSFVAVLTQERLLRLLQKNTSLKLDLVLIDEAHNLFGEKSDDSRATLLAQTIMILKKRNENTILNFFSPFISNPNNLKIKQSNYNLSSQDTDEFIKTEKYFTCNLYNSDGELKIYNQFTNTFLQTNKKYENIIELLNNEKADKNIIYFNSPKHIERFSREFSNSIQNSNLKIDEISATISDFIHPDYNLINCIKKGIVYHHGGMPEIIRLYVEDIFTKKSGLNFVITSSTLLEGVNIPAEKIFLLSIKKGRGNLSVSQFKNLIGRVNRFSEIFNYENGDLKLLEPNIYIVKTDYENKSANIEKFISDRAKTEVQFNDDVNNLFLKDEETLTEPQKNELKKSLEYLENIEPNSTSLENVSYVQSEIAQLCFKNNIYDFDIKENENLLLRNLNLYKTFNKNLISTSNELIEAIFLVFLQNIEILDNNLKRLKNAPARNFYSMILEWRSSSYSYKEMIGSFLRYWKTLTGDAQKIYIGEKWGEEKREVTDIKPLYVDLRKKDNIQKINLSILKIKEEQDFVEFNLLKYIEILAELELIEGNFYEKIKYGSSDKNIITLLKNGFSIELAKCIVKAEYSSFITLNNQVDEILINEKIVDEMEVNGENKILIFEIKYHINNL